MVAAVYFAYCVCFCLAWRVCYVRAGGRMRFHVNNQGRVLPCRAKHACRFGASFENGGEAQTVLDRYHEVVGVEPRITGDLQALGLNLWNLQFRVKSASGTVDKVLNRGKRFDALCYWLCSWCWAYFFLGARWLRVRPTGLSLRARLTSWT